LQQESGLALEDGGRGKIVTRKTSRGRHLEKYK
jgi:hypothetical protein